MEANTAVRSPRATKQHATSDGHRRGRFGTDALCRNPDFGLEWHNIDWRVVDSRVRDLQIRIVKAVKEGRWNKVKTLQNLLTSSLPAKLLAVRRVTENQGRNTPGVDGEIWDTPEKKLQGALELSRKGYRPSVLRRIYIPKKNGKLRPLSIPTMKDRAMQALYLLSLQPVAETTADPHSYGFRPRRAPWDATERLFKLLSPNRAASWVLDADIEGCFDNIDHDWLMANVPMDKEILKKFLKAGFLESGVVYDLESGTPQGGIISPTLANLALDGLEDALRQKFRPRVKNGKTVTPKVALTRYADDFVVTGASQEVLENEVQAVVEEFLAERGLELQKSKTTVRSLADGFDFLGITHRRFPDGKYICTPSKEAVNAFRSKIRDVFKQAQGANALTLVNTLNPILDGWANYHRIVSAKETFAALDDWMFQKLARWTRRSHRNKNQAWIRSQYWGRRGNSNWNFHASDADGNKVWLHKMKRTPIWRHILIKGDANPFDPEWDSYFEDRRIKLLGKPFAGKRVAVLKRQQGMCAECGLPLLPEETGLDVHHIQWRTNGGSNKVENLQALHPNCHRQHHSLDRRKQRVETTISA